MTKLFDASCQAGIVLVGAAPVAEAEVLSQGTKSSTGVLVMDEERARYIASNATDIADFLEQVASALNTIATTLTAIGAGMTGPTTSPPPALATSVTSIVLVATQLSAMKVNLK